MELTFNQWLAEVDRYVSGALGVGIRDLADQPYRDWYDDELPPKEAAGEILAGEGFDPAVLGVKAKKKGKKKKPKVFVITAYLDGGGGLQFHFGPEGDFETDIAANYEHDVLKKFWIEGRYLREEGDQEPIAVS